MRFTTLQTSGLNNIRSTKLGNGSLKQDKKRSIDCPWLVVRLMNNSELSFISVDKSSHPGCHPKCHPECHPECPKIKWI